jgi:hypothetical protein
MKQPTHEKFKMRRKLQGRAYCRNIAGAFRGKVILSLEKYIRP